MSGKRGVATTAVGWTLGVVAVLVVVLVVAVPALISAGLERAWDTPSEEATSAPTDVADTSGINPETGLDLSNEAYRQRLGDAESDALAAESAPAVEAALLPLTGTGEPVTGDDVVAALAAAGFDDVQVTPPTSPLGDEVVGVGVGVAVPGGCVFGGVRPEGVSLDSGGVIADGGCLEMPTH